MGTQLIVAGFHRSGTSLTAQLLYRSGVFLGYDMLPRNRSNPHGHFEDREIVSYHDKILEDNGLTWQVDGSSLPVVEDSHRRRLMQIIEKREAEQEIWGFKDPRVCLFMNTWKSLLPDARVLIVYRGFADSTYSLHRRAADGLLYKTGKQHYHRRLWDEPDLALKMWIVHNKPLIDFANTYPEDVLAASFSMLRKKFPLIKTLNRYWGLALEEVPTSEVFDAEATAERPGKQLVSNEKLIGEALETWEALERLGRRTEELTGVSVEAGEPLTEEAFYKPADAYALGMEKDFLDFKLQYAAQKRLEESENSRNALEEGLTEARNEQKRLRTQLRKARENTISPQRKKELEEAEKDLKLIVQRMSGSKFASLFRLKREFRELESRYLHAGTLENAENSYAQNGPVVVGGIGGSGTRVIAEMLALFGFHIGDDLNSASDNLWYTLLFKRPRWYCRNRNNRQIIEVGLGLLRKAMVGKKVPTYSELMFLSQALISMGLYGHNQDGAGRGSWSLKRAQQMLTANIRGEYDYRGWGFKEPNSHLLIRDMAEYFDGLKYVHVIRHGLDMAFSSNQQQLFNWGALYGVKVPQHSSEIPRLALKYWVRANRQAVQVGEELGQDKFLLLNFDELCTSPESETRKFASFLEIDPEEDVFRRACAIPQKPKSAGRYRKCDLGQFDDEDLAGLQELGFAIS